MGVVRRQKAYSVAEILKAVLPPEGKERLRSLELIRYKWATIVGNELALRSEPSSLGVRVLTVRVNDPVWGRMILKVEWEILARLSTTIGSGVVERIQFIRRERPLWDGEAPPMPVERKETVSRPPELIINAAQSIKDPDLRDQVTRAASRYLAAQADRRR